ncbi:preprotein translocase subunit YajC [Corynebacterium yudongzhengii]|uniref:Preprotein translocase subunit YajC n=1 Tax=Corynebacterium yudongzhengii TaxID=2080740 RepID=A0A2U1T465_9CORY|nr:preprotein translocase subunit YajC [Corynebacterium yudongzhengii]AWB81800.1 preprotein translocase subunit YajC [Corynebacterium yudongzhengii]PWC00791.1 preprotein translocase subunit YajC [Corynebacterium yudongzhengii]
MEIIVFLVIIALFFIPSFLMMRKQRQHQAEITKLQEALGVDDYVITAAGLHGRIADLAETTVDLEVAPGTIITMERAGVMRNVTQENRQVEAQKTEEITDNEPEDGSGEHPENFR